MKASSVFFWIGSLSLTLGFFVLYQERDTSFYFIASLILSCSSAILEKLERIEAILSAKKKDTK